jgi:hypothetical protein
MEILQFGWLKNFLLRFCSFLIINSCHNSIIKSECMYVGSFFNDPSKIIVVRHRDFVHY